MPISNKGYYMRTFSAGRYRKVIRYTRALPGDSPPVRSAKQLKSTSAQRYINIRDCTERLLWLLCANYDHKTACFCTLTFDDDHLPPSRKDVQEHIKKLIRQLRPVFRRQDRDFPVIYTVEGQPQAALPQADSAWETAPWKDRRRWDALDDQSEDELNEDTVRLHAHMFLLLEPEDRELVRSLWPHGYIYINSIRVNDFRSFQRLAAYVTKESRLGIRPEKERSYIPSLGLIQPDSSGHWCSEFEGIGFPSDAEILGHGDDHDEVYDSHSEWVTYRLPRKPTKPKPYKSKGRISGRRKSAKTK